MHFNVLNKLYTLFSLLYRHAHTQLLYGRDRSPQSNMSSHSFLRYIPNCDTPIMQRNNTQLPFLCRCMQLSACVQWEQGKPHATYTQHAHTPHTHITYRVNAERELTILELLYWDLYTSTPKWAFHQSTIYSLYTIMYSHAETWLPMVHAHRGLLTGKHAVLPTVPQQLPQCCQHSFA